MTPAEIVALTIAAATIVGVSLSLWFLSMKASRSRSFTKVAVTISSFLLIVVVCYSLLEVKRYVSYKTTTDDMIASNRNTLQKLESLWFKQLENQHRPYGFDLVGLSESYHLDIKSLDTDQRSRLMLDLISYAISEDTTVLASLTYLPEWSMTASYLAGFVHYERGNYRDAVITMSKVAAKLPRNKSVLNNVGVSYYGLGDTARAFEYFKKAIELDGAYMIGLHNLARAYSACRRFDLAEKLYLRLVRVNSDDVVAVSAAAFAALNQKKYNEAIERYSRALELMPRSARMHNGLGSSYYLRGDTVNALRCFHQALAIDDSLNNAWLNLAQLQFDVGSIDSAVCSVDKYVKLPNPTAHGFYVRARILERAGRPREAIVAYDSATSLNPRYSAAKDRRDSLAKLQ